MSALTASRFSGGTAFGTTTCDHELVSVVDGTAATAVERAGSDYCQCKRLRAGTTETSRSRFHPRTRA